MYAKWIRLFGHALAPCYAISSLAVPAAWPTTSWHGQAKQPMMLRGQSVSAGVSDVQIPSTWSSVGAKGAVAAVWPQSM